jgi:hypothetical protein
MIVVSWSELNVSLRCNNTENSLKKDNRFWIVDAGFWMDWILDRGKEIGGD